MKHKITITFEIEALDYISEANEPDNADTAVQIAKDIIEGMADWPQDDSMVTFESGGVSKQLRLGRDL